MTTLLFSTETRVKVLLRQETEFEKINFIFGPRFFSWDVINTFTYLITRELRKEFSCIPVNKTIVMCPFPVMDLEHSRELFTKFHCDYRPLVPW